MKIGPHFRALLLLLITCWLGAVLRAQGDAAAANAAAIQAVYPVMLGAVDAGNFTQARNLCEQVIVWDPANPVHRYNLACIESRAGGPMLPRALAALEQAVQLGFNDVHALQNDPDLAAIRGEPKFAELVRLVSKNVTAAAPQAALKARPAPPAQFEPVQAKAAANDAPAAAAPTAAVETPAPAAFKNGVPVGLYFMTRFWPATGSLEKAAWYFAPDGTAYEKLEHGFSKADLAAHAGPKGTCQLVGGNLEVTWTDGKKTSSWLEHKPNTTGFSWNAGLFSAAQDFGDPAEIAGVYAGGESLSVGASRAAVSKTLDLRPDGTFAWTGVSFIGSTTKESRVSVGSTGGGSTGTWRLAGHSLLLTDGEGNVFRRIAFPYDDTSTPIKPDRIFFGGMMYKKQE
ncbi:MAG: hypothetical protein Q7S40_30460 [Opitutaceae bacterium]|nr:hypothetical protein [Opitutaceae bacterium]